MDGIRPLVITSTTFSMSGEEIRFKYSTYGHADSEALELPLRDVHDDGDLMLAVTCAEGNHIEKAERSFDSIPGTVRPIYYLNEEARRARHILWQDIVRKDEQKRKYGQSNVGRFFLGGGLAALLVFFGVYFMMR